MPSGRSSRAKGVSGERESADIFRRHGALVTRLQNNVLDAGDYIAEWPTEYDTDDSGIVRVGVTLLVDSKRRERLSMLAASRQVEAVARDGQVPVVVWRPSREPWRASLPLEDFARLLGEAS